VVYAEETDGNVNPFPNENRSAVSKQGMADSFILGAAIST
jgi:hypothetical protein